MSTLIIQVSVSQAAVSTDQSNSGLQFHMNFDEGSGLVTSDDVSYLTGNLDGASWVKGLTGYGVYFENEQDHVKIDDNTLFDLLTNDFTITLWLKLDKMDDGDRYNLISQTDGTFEQKKWFLYLQKNADQYNLAFHAFDNNLEEAIDEVSTSFDLGMDSWNFITITKSGSDYTMYHNGIEVSAFTWNKPLSNPAEGLSIGASDPWDHYLRAPKGSIDEVSIYDEVLLSSDINEIMEEMLLQRNRVVKILAISNNGEEMEIDVEKNEFDDNYNTYGNNKMIIDISTTVSETINPDLLHESQADVLYLHNLVARSLSQEEQYAIIDYVSEGHGIVATHETLTRNVLLAPLFGINPEMFVAGGTNTMPFSDTMILDDTNHPLVTKLSNPYPVDRTTTAALDGKAAPWENDPRIMLENGTILGTSTTGEMAIIYSEGENLRSVYMTHNPADSQSTDDLQLLYNSLSWTSETSIQPSHYIESANGNTATDDTITIYEIVTITNSTDTGSSIAPIFADVPIRLDMVILSLFIVGLISSNDRRRRS